MCALSKIIGIDLGTSNSCISVIDGGSPAIIPNLNGKRITPSVVAITNKGDKIVGETAKRQAATNPKNTISSIKRKMGSADLIPFGEEELSPQAISAMILEYLKNAAEEFLGEPVTEAIITVPAYFTDAQRQATKDAGELAGLKVPRIINEPTAAALAYGADKEGAGTVMVYDLGGGTFDISVLRLNGDIFEVVATNGDNHLGGDDFDMLLATYIRDEFKKAHDIDLLADIVSRARVLEAAESAKVELSTTTEATVNLPYIASDSTGPIHLEMTISRSVFEDLISDLIDKTIKLMQKTLKDADLTFADINKVLLVGGSTRIPMVAREITELSGISPSKNVNPDECVAMGAAIQAAIISGDIKDLILLDVTPLSLGIEVQGGLFSRIIEKNTTIPYSAHKVFSTAVDNQKEVGIKVYQGERELARNNKMLGEFILGDIESAPRGVPQIDVSFDIDINGIVSISAVDLKTGNAQSITLASQKSISDEEVKKAIDDANKNASKDKEAKEHVEVINKANALIQYANKVFSEKKDEIKNDVLEKGRIMIRELNQGIIEEDIDVVKAKTGELDTFVSRLLTSKESTEKED